MKKRSLFTEIAERFDALAEKRAGKRTLRAHEVAARPAPGVTAEELIAMRERLNLSRPVLARYLRTTHRTLGNWEQGLAHPEAQASLLIRLVERYPDTRGTAGDDISKQSQAATRAREGAPAYDDRQTHPYRDSGKSQTPSPAWGGCPTKAHDRAQQWPSGTALPKSSNALPATLGRLLPPKTL